MTPSPLQVIHVFPYCHKVSGGHSNAIRGINQAEVDCGIESLMFCPACDDPSLSKFLSEDKVVAHRGGGEELSEVPVGAANQIVHLHAVNLQAMRLARHLRRRLVAYVLTSHGTLNYRGPLHFLKKFAALNVASTIVRKAGGIHFLSERERRRFRWLVPGWSGKILVAQHPLSLANHSQVAAARRDEFGIPADGFLFLYLGRLDLHTKGLDILLQGFSKMPAGRGVRLALVGPDWQGGQARLAALARTLGCGNRVHFLGPQYGAAKWAVLKMADAFVSPSRWDAGPVAVMEAIGCGLAVITSAAINPAQELAEQGAAYICPLSASGVSQAMTDMVTDAGLRRKLQLNGQAWVRDHCSPTMVGRALAEFYEQVLTPGR